MDDFIVDMTHEVAAPMRLTAEPTMGPGSHTAGASTGAAFVDFPSTIFATTVNLFASLYAKVLLLSFSRLYEPDVDALFDAYVPSAAIVPQTVGNEGGASPSSTRAAQRFENEWGTSIQGWKLAWLQMSFVNASLLALLVFFMQFSSARIAAEPVTRTVAQLALVAALNGTWVNTLYQFVFHQASCEDVKAAARWTETAAKRAHYRFTAVPHLLATPAAWTAWSLCLFLMFAMVLSSGIFAPHVGSPLSASLDVGALPMPLAAHVVVSVFAVLAALHTAVNVYYVATMSRGGTGTGLAALEDGAELRKVRTIPPLAFVHA